MPYAMAGSTRRAIFGAMYPVGSNPEARRVASFVTRATARARTAVSGSRVVTATVALSGAPLISPAIVVVNSSACGSKRSICPMLLFPASRLLRGRSVREASGATSGTDTDVR